MNHTATGKYTITLTTPFASANYVTLLAPFVVATGLRPTSGYRGRVLYVLPVWSGLASSRRAFADTTFMFACVGPR